MTFQAFANHDQSTAIDNLTIENQGDRLSIYGSLQIKVTAQGLSDAQTLLKILQDTVDYLQRQNLSENRSEIPEAERIQNPFLNDHTDRDAD